MQGASGPLQVGGGGDHAEACALQQIAGQLLVHGLVFHEQHAGAGVVGLGECADGDRAAAVMRLGERLIGVDVREITTADLLGAIQGVVPLAKTAPEKITSLRTWAEGHARRASSAERKASGQRGELDLG